MKLLFAFLLFLRIEAAFAQNCCPYIGATTVIPQGLINPGSYVTIYTQIGTTYLGNKLSASFSTNLAQKEISLEVCYFNGNLAQPKLFTDTFAIGQLIQAGTYTVNFNAYLSSSPQSCIKDTMNSMTFTIELGYSQVGFESFTADVSIASLYPNPVTNYLTIDINRTIDFGRASIVNSTGEVVVNDIELKSQVNLDIGFLPKGLYFLKIDEKIDPRLLRFIKD